MTLETEKLLDYTGWQLLQALQQDARLSYTELGQRVGLTAPAVAERVRKMEDAGIISGYHAEINRTKIGFPITAIIRMSTFAGERCTGPVAFIQDIPEVLECSRVTGSDSLVLKVMAASIEHLEMLIDRLSSHGQLTTSMVLSTPLRRRVIKPGVDSSRELSQTPTLA